MTHRRAIIVACLTVFISFVPSLVPDAAAAFGRLAAGGPPPTPHARRLAARAPQAPFEAEVIYRTPPAPEASSGDAANPAQTASVRNYIIVINYLLDNQIADELNAYIDDIEAEGLTVEMIQVASTGDAEALRDLLITKYNELPSLEGCFFMGHTPPFWFREPGDSIFPCELCYMDMDGDWIDSDGDTVADLHSAGSGDEGPEIYCGRITAHNLTLEAGQDEVSLTKRYLNKVHDYRRGEGVSNGKACLYIDDPWRWWTSQYATEMAQAWPEIDEYDDPYQTIASDYLTKLQVPYEHLRVNVHYGAYGHGFGIPPDLHGGDVSSADIVAAPPQGLSYHLYCCTAGDWTDPDKIGLWYIMTGNAVGVLTSSKSGGMNDATEFYGPIGQEHSVGYAIMNWFDSFAPYDEFERGWTLGMLWLGDPTLGRPHLMSTPFSLTAPTDAAQHPAPDLTVSWEASTSYNAQETVTYRLIVDDDDDFCSPELVVEGLTDTFYHITAADGLSRVWQHWRVEAVTSFGRVRQSNQTWLFTIALDGDLDGMGDDWEEANGLDSADAYDALHDADGDGLLNREEHDINADPRNGASPAFIYVDDDNAGDPAQDGSFEHPYASIQTAIDAATAPAVVKVLPGTYAEFVTMASKVWVVGSGASQTAIAVPSGGPVALFSGVEDGLLAACSVTCNPTAVLIRSLDSSATVRDCVLAGANNGMGVNFTGSMKLINCLLADNASYGLWAGGTVIVDIVNCTVANNTTCGARFTSQNNVKLQNSIFFGNGDDLSISSKANVTAAYCDISDGDFSGTGGCFSADPLFVAGPGHGYYLSQTAAGQAANSPCVDAGDPTCITSVDRLTTRTDSVRDTGTVDLGCHSPYALRIGSITAASPVTLEWNAQPGLEYVVEWSIDRQNWNEVDVGETGSWIDTDTTAYAMKYYRVREK